MARASPATRTSPSSSSRPRSRAGSSAATTPAECVDIVIKSDAALPKGHQTWQLNEVNGIIWPSPNGIGITDSAAFDRTVQVALDGKILTKPVEGTPWRNDLAEKALAELGDVDTKGASWQKATVTLTEGGK